jgi:alpha,alpha-trehalase
MAHKVPAPDLLFPELFEEVQLSGVFPDSKTFVDCSPRYNTDQILAAYHNLRSKKDFDLKQFVLDHFSLPADHACGFQADLSRTAEEHVNALWPFLKRPGMDRVRENDSLIPIPHDYIVPGGRFGEIYYWDSYFTMLGLASAGRIDSIEQMIRNFSFMIRKYGHIPNGNRTYFISRSQPPFFAFMVDLFSKISNNPGVLDEFGPDIVTEYRFWMSGERYLPEYGLNRYWDNRPIPRQESYSEDIELADHWKGSKEELFRHVRAACESGWDFTVRWFSDGMNMHSINASNILPVDLNALLFGVERILSSYYESIGELQKVKAVAFTMQRRKRALEDYCWDAETRFYYDFDMTAGIKTPIESLAAVYPLFTGLASGQQAEAVAALLRDSFLFSGGLVSTAVDSGQQWDFPNGWAPLHWIAVKGLADYGHLELALEIARRWTELNETVYRNTGKFVEKYNVVDTSLLAGGGEYPVQDGFGWSNGVYLALKDFIRDNLR